jgi:phytoene synthase
MRTTVQVQGPPASWTRGARQCRSITRHYARTFYFASHCLPRDVRAHAYAVYGFCRWADNGVDDAPDRAEAARRLDRARHALDQVYGTGPLPPALSTFQRTVRRRAIPRQLFDDLLDGMAMDLTVSRYDRFADLEVYCYRVAGVVGLMMTYVFGFRHPRCFPRAIALGNAMQLTNILRDVGEDLQRGRVYLPRDELARFGVEESQLVEGRIDDRWRALMRFQIDRARRLYAESEPGIPDLIGPTARLTVRVMGRLYAGILDAIERSDFDVFHRRARVPLEAKLRTLAACQTRTWRESAHRAWL